MSCKSAIYTTNATNGTVTTDAGTFVQIPFGSVVRRYGQSLGLDGGSIICCNNGYFDVESSLSYTPTAAGPVTIEFRQDGVAVPGLMAVAQGTAGEPMNLKVSGLVRNCRDCCNSTLTAWVNAPGNVTNFATVVEKQ